MMRICVLDVLFCGVRCAVEFEMGSVCVFARHEQKSSPHALSARPFRALLTPSVSVSSR